MRVPDLYEIGWLVDDSVPSKQLRDGSWYPARPLGLVALCLHHRLRLAWRVFTGRYDAIDWRTESE